MHVLVDPDELAIELRKRFTTWTTGRALRLREIEPLGDAVRVIFDGRPGDQGGPYGALVAVPRDDSDPRWSDWPEFSKDEWIDHAAFGVIAEAYWTGAVAATVDGITWLRLDQGPVR
ncbi:hypothetical protein ET495_12415 [Xylanimonas allomyrinae]|uniref:Uncharacterized protein n=1 Tax=Xylanimonas allomyrinae TaxID=2509459 RepID=A0A4P6EML6_9MICO|nr:hypothetical protein [Xylanimonas allomyrinae]QAY63904.1 hypothetical protein ET495_12415 [Xylanimonas allomyrinae]